MKYRTILVGIILFLSFGNQRVLGVLYVDDGQEHTIDHAWDAYVWVDYQNPGAGTSLNIVPGGMISRLTAYEDSVIRINGGSIQKPSGSDLPDSSGIQGHDNSQITMNSGHVHGCFDASDSSRVTIHSGSISDRLSLGGNAQAEVHYVHTARLVSRWNSHLNFYDGWVSWQILADHTGTIILHGYDFMIDGNPVDYGPLVSINGNLYYEEPVRHITGFTNSGEISADLYIGRGAQVILAPIPEPCMLLLLGFGGLLIRKRRL